MARRPRPVATIAAVTWRDGVHLTGTPIWCDARRRRDVCFVSSADRVGKAGHGQLIATPQTLALLGAGHGHLAVPLNKPFTLGTVRLELLASGRSAGAAALYVELGARRVLYAGAIRDGADVRACDAVVVAAPTDVAKLPALDEAVARVAKWVRGQLAASKKPVLVVDSIVDAIEVATALPVPVACPRAVCEAAARAGLGKLRGKGEVQLRVGAHASGTRVALDGDLVWPFAATRAQLLAWIERTGARAIYITGAAADSIAGALGPRAHALGPPQQMTLFREAR